MLALVCASPGEAQKSNASQQSDVFAPTRRFLQQYFPAQRQDLAIAAFQAIPPDSASGFSWRVENRGSRFAIKTGLRVWLDGREVGVYPVPGLEPRQSDQGSASFTRPPEPGEHLLTARIEPHPDGIETNRGNDSASVRFTIPAPVVSAPTRPDLALVEFAYVREGGRNLLEWKVENVGDAGAPRSTLRVVRPAGQETLAVIRPLAPGDAALGRTALQRWLQSGSYGSRAIVEPGPASSEENLVNNRRDVKFVISPDAGYRDPDASIEVPDLAGLSESEARAVVRSAGLALGSTAGGGIAPGVGSRVVSQQPAAGTRVPRRAEVSIVLASTLPDAVIPGVILVCVGAVGSHLVRRGRKPRVERERDHPPETQWGVQGKPAVPTCRVIKRSDREIRLGIRAIPSPPVIRIIRHTGRRLSPEERT